MKTGIVVLCRYESSRLPGKILRKIKGSTILSRIIGKLRLVPNVDEIVVATSTEMADRPIAEHCEKLGIACFRGDHDDVAERFYNCAAAHELDYTIRINGDNLFTDPVIIRQMVRLLDDDVYDFITNVHGRTFPFGMSVEILRTGFYASILPLFNEARYHEHVTLYLYEHPELGKRHYFYNTICPELKGVNLAIDTENDLQLAEKIYSRLSDIREDIGLTELCEIKDFIRDESLGR